MEISLTHVLLAAVGMGFLVIIVQVILFNKIKLVQADVLQKSTDANALLSSTVEAIPHLVQAQIHTGVAEITTAVETYQNKSLQSFKAVNQLILTKLQETQTENTNMYNQLQTLVEQFKLVSNQSAALQQQTLSTIVTQLGSNHNEAQASINETRRQLDTALQDSLSKVLAQLASDHGEMQNHVNEANRQLNTALQDSLTKVLAQLASDHGEMQNHVNEANRQLNTAIKLAQVEVGKESNKLLFTYKQQQLANLETLSGLIQNLRVQNLVELTNELAQHTELSVDTQDFVKHLGECKVVKVEDKHSGQVTQIYYENGVKHSSDTLLGEQLKYQMFYDHDGKLVKGIEYDEQQRVSFEYLYDAAGEINQRVEFAYDANGKQAEPISKVY
ncbi:hypothetical protein GCM10009347_32620 [Shewanella algicola]|uniref:Methyl-accepting chemotaxis protein n=1 Tax=Shewanella algicola TaxID=640633 RepID=A0A9X1Z771_9GAMM|nr:hypothetical protein [Shewanella algicola]MCL1107010.1 hypothetical protein [Shewanella algicola]GGP64147.1 hypothetical protein GCM10009347_32620 [Shewanella algicola]